MADDIDRKISKGSASKLPADKVNLKVILVSACTKEFLFNPSDTVSVVTEYIFNNWPGEWPDDEKPESNILRLIYQGRFLHGNVSLGALQLPLGKTTVMHLVARESLPEPNSQGNLRKDKGQRRSSNAQQGGEQPGCCASCLIS